MTALLQIALSNLAMAAGLALVAATVGRWSRRPALAHALWVLVLVKLITPPLVLVPLPPLDPDTRPSHVAATSRAMADSERPPAGRSLALPAGSGVGPELFPVQPVDEDDAVGAETPDAAEAPWPESRPPAPLAEQPHATAQVLDEPASDSGEEEAKIAPAATVAWSEPIAIVWLGGAFLWLLVAGWRVWQFERLLRYGRIAPENLQAETASIAERLGILRPDVWLVSGAVSPMIWVLGRSRRLLLPQALLARLNDEQRAALLTHELAHLRRGDHWVRLLELIVLGLYWWCPLVWWAQRELREAEEECCDAWVLWAWPACARAYAHALVDTVDFLSETQPVLHPAASGFGPVRSLRRRVTMIMQGKTPRALTWAGVVGVVALAAVALPLVPGWAQSPRYGPPADPRSDRREEEQHDAKDQAEAILQKRLAVQKSLIEKEAAELQRLRAEVERRAKDIQTALERLRQAELELAAGKRPAPQPPVGKPGSGDLERRLRDLESKLDTVLREVLEMRKELKGRARPQEPRPEPVSPAPTTAPTPATVPQPASPQATPAPSTPSTIPSTPSPRADTPR